MSDQDWSKEKKGEVNVFKKSKEILQDIVVQVVDNAKEVVDAAPLDNSISEGEFNQLSKLVMADGDSNTFNCSICGYKDGDLARVAGHIMTQHPLWKDYKITQAKQISNVYLSPDWKQKLNENFIQVVVQKCSEDSRAAWSTNENIHDQAKYTIIRREIVQKLVDYIVGVFGTTSCPSVDDLREIVRENLTDGYPWMFGTGENTASKDNKISHGYGRGGINGAEELPRQLRDRIAKQISKKRKAEIIDENPDEGGSCSDLSATKKGRKPSKYGGFKFQIYLSYFILYPEFISSGVDNYKFYASGSETQKQDIASAETIEDEAGREEIFSRNRNEISEQARNSGKPLNSVIKGFFRSPLHLHNQFIFLTSVGDLKETISKNWSVGIQKMEEYIRKKDRRGMIKIKLEEAETKTQLEYSGATTFKDLVIIRGLADLLDKDGRGILLFSGEEIVTSGPFIKVIEKNDR